MRLITISLCSVLSCLSVAAQSAKPGLGPCALLTKAEVQDAVGAAVSDGVVNSHNKSVCDFAVGATGSSISLMLTDRSSADSAERTVAELKKHKISAAVVAGFGDGAYASSPGYGMQQLGVFKGSKQVIVTVMLFGAPEPKVKSIAQQVMRKALARLP
jgi:hypothetical protein